MTAIETINMRPISSFSLEVQAAYQPVVQHVTKLLWRTGVMARPVDHELGHTFYTEEGDEALVKILPWDSRRLDCLSDMQPGSHWGVSICIWSELLSAESLQALWNSYQGFYYPGPPNPLVVPPNFEEAFHVIHLRLDEGGINFLSRPGADLDQIPPELRSVAEDFSRASLPFEMTAWATMAAVFRIVAQRAQAELTANESS